MSSRFLAFVARATGRKIRIQRGQSVDDPWQQLEFMPPPHPLASSGASTFAGCPYASVMTRGHFSLNFFHRSATIWIWSSYRGHPPRLFYTSHHHIIVSSFSDSSCGSISDSSAIPPASHPRHFKFASPLLFFSHPPLVFVHVNLNPSSLAAQRQQAYTIIHTPRYSFHWSMYSNRNASS